MSQYENLEELLAGEKTRKPWLDDGTWTDEDIYRLYRDKNPVAKPLWEEHDKQIDRGISGDVSANAMNGLASTFDYFIDEESSNWMKLAYNKSLTGLTEQLFSGDERYDLDHYEAGIVADVASTALSFMMPLDLLTFWAGGQLAKPIAGFAAKGLGYSAQKIATVKGAEIIIPAYRVMAQKTLQKTGQRALLQGINQGTALAVFEGAIGGVQAAINGEEILPGITEGVIHGGIMGGLAGAVGGGLMAKHAQFFGVSAGGAQVAKGALEGKVLSPWDYVKKVGTGIPGQLLAESAVFTAPTAYELSKTDELTVKNLAVEYAKTLGLFGILKTKHHLFERGGKFLDEHHTLFGKPPKDHGVDNVVKGVQENLEETSKGSIENKKITQDNIDGLDRLRTKLFEKAEIDKAEYDALKEDIDWLRKGLKDNSLSNSNKKDVERAVKTITKLKGLLSDIDAEYKEQEGLGGITSVVKEEFDGWKNEMALLDDKINNLDNIKVTKPEDMKITSGVMKKYLKKKGIKTIERDTDPETGKVLDEPIEIPLAKATKEEIQEEYTATKEIVGEEIEYKKAETGVAGVEEIAEATTQQIRKEFGMADIAEAESKVESIKEADIKSLPTAEKDSKKFLNRQELDSSHTDYIEPQSKETNMILADWLNSLKSKDSSDAMSVTRFLNKIGKKDISEITFDDIKNWVEKKAEANEQIESDLQNITNSIQHANDRGFITKLPYTRKQMKPLWNISNELIKQRSEVVKGVAGTISEELGGIDKTFVHVDKSTKKDLEINTVANLHGKEGFGLRASEINKLKPENIIKRGDYYEIKLTSTEAKSFARPVPINKKTYDAIQKVIKNKNIKEGRLIFDKGSSSKAAEMSGIKKKLLARGVKPQLELVLRKLAETTWGIKGLTQSGINYFKSLMGHEVKWSDKIYGTTASPKQLDRINALARKVIDGKLSGEKFEKGVRDILGVKTTEQLQLARQTKLRKVKLEEQKKQRQFFLEIAEGKLPDFKIKLNQKLGKKNGERILGSASEYTARIAKGEVREDTISHEVSHVFTETIEALGTPESKRLLQTGLRAVRQHYRKELAKLPKDKRLAQEKELLNQTVGEMATKAMKTEKRWEQMTGEKAPLYQKLGRVIKKFWSQMKIALGMGSEKDVARIMAEGFVTGKLVPIAEKGAEISKVEYYQTERTATSLQSEIKVHEKTIGNKLEIKEAREFEGFTIPSGKGSWKKGFEDGSLTTKMLDQYLQRVRELAAGRKPVGVKINEIDREFNVKPEERKLVLEQVFGVRNGDVKNITSKTLYKAYGDVIARYKNKLERNDSATDIMIANKESNKLPQSFFRRAVTDTFHLIRDYFSEKLAHRMTAHERLETDYRGDGSDAVYRINKLIGKDIKRLDLYDPAVVARKRAADVLTKKDERFIAQLKVKGSNERKAVAIHKAMMNHYWKSLFAEFKQHMPDITFEQFKKDYGQKFINNYFTRKVNRQALEYMDKNAEYFQRVVDSMMKDSATSKAKKDLKGKKGVTATDIDNLRDVYLEDTGLRTEVAEQIWDMLHYSPMKVQNKNLFTRGIMLPEYIPVIKDGKTQMIRVYEPNYGATLESYIMNMSKFLATARHFPEFTKIATQYKISGATKATLIDAKSKKGELGEMSEYAYQALMSQLGSDIYRDQLNSGSRRFFSGTASLFAATGLSSPLSGIKNLLIGMPRAVATFGLKNTISGVRTVWDAATWEVARKKGLTEYGAHSLELREKKLPGVPISMEFWFKFNLMTQTENFNRIVSAHAGTLFFNQVMSRYKGEPTMFKGVRGKKNDYRIMREVWKMSKEEIDWIEKTDVSAPENAIKYKAILDKVIQESHIATQGGTSTVRLPLWMQSPYKKELTLFQRIATSVTIDTYHNYIKPAVKHQNYTPLFKALVGHGLSGAALYSMYDTILGQEPPKSQANGLERAGMYLWRGEFFGVLGEALSPYERELAMPIMEPVIYRNLKEGGSNLMAVYSGAKTWDAGIADFTRRSVVLVGQIDRLIKKTQSPHWEKHKRIRTLTGQFMKDKGYNTPTSYVLSEKQPFYRTLSDALMFGNDDAIGKSYWAAMNFLISDQGQHNITNAKYATKEAHQSIMNSVKGRMNPLNLSNEKIISGKRIRLYSKREEFLNWLSPEKRREAIALENEYYFRLRKFEKLIAKKRYREDYSVFPWSVFVK